MATGIRLFYHLSSFCSLKGAFLQNEDPIDFIVSA